MTIDLKKKVSTVFFILTFAAVAELLTNVILGRGLPAETFGRFKFITTIVMMLSSLFLFGQNTAIIKVMGKHDFALFNWKRFTLSCLCVSASVGLVTVAGIGYLYKFTYESYFIYLAFLSAIAVEFISSILRARGSYNFAMFVGKSNSFFLCFGVIIIFYVFKIAGLMPILFLLIFLPIIPLILGLSVLKDCENGSQKLPTKVITEGFFLFFITISFVALGQIDQFFMQKCSVIRMSLITL